MTDSNRSVERLPKAAQWVNAVNQFQRIHGNFLGAVGDRTKGGMLVKV
jgi:hypothetical protein